MAIQVNDNLILNPAFTGSKQFADINYIKGAFKVYESGSDMTSAPIVSVDNNQIVWVENSQSLYKATKTLANPPFTFVDTVEWNTFSFSTGSGGGGSGFRLSESDIRSISLKNKDGILRKFLNLSFYFSVNSEGTIQLDFTKDPFKLAQNIIERFKPDGILSGATTAFTYDMRRFLISREFQRCKYIEKIPKSGFNELFFRVVSYHILHFYKNKNQFDSN